MLCEQCLLIDAATPLIQVAHVVDGKISMVHSRIGHCVDVLFPIVCDIMDCCELSWDNMDGMIYCSGPGSAMGLRTALMSILTWKIFNGRKLQIFSYCSLDMCRLLYPNAKTFITCGTGNSVVKMDVGSCEPCLTTIDDLQNESDIKFLNTRHVIPAKFAGFDQVIYDLNNVSCDIHRICHPSDGTIHDFGDNNYVKWAAGVHVKQ